MVYGKLLYTGFWNMNHKFWKIHLQLIQMCYNIFKDGDACCCQVTDLVINLNGFFKTVYFFAFQAVIEVSFLQESSQ